MERQERKALESACGEAEESALWRLEASRDSLNYAINTLGTPTPDSNAVTNVITHLTTTVEWMGVARERRQRLYDYDQKTAGRTQDGEG